MKRRSSFIIDDGRMAHKRSSLLWRILNILITTVEPTVCKETRQESIQSIIEISINHLSSPACHPWFSFFLSLWRQRDSTMNE